jgi:membrane-bound serine protease (ClpP class)
VRTLSITGAPPQPTAPPRLRRAIAVVLLLVGFVALAASGAEAQTPGSTPASTDQTVTSPPGKAATVSVVSVNGYIDPVLAALMTRAIDDANNAKALALVFQVDLQGAVIPDEQLTQLVKKMADSAVPVNVWIGPTGSELNGAAVALIFGAQKIAMAPGTHIGNLPPRLDAGSLKSALDKLPSNTQSSLGLGRIRTDIQGSALYDQTLDAKAAEDAHIAEFAPTLLLFFVTLPGVETKEVTANGQTHREPVTNVVFSQLSLLDNFMHTVASPAVAYLLFTVGLALLIFELFTAGVGVAGVIGAGAVVLSCYGLAVLPARPWAIALLVLAMLAFAVDVQTGVPRVWTGVGMVLYVVASLTLYDGVSMSWLTIVVGIVSVALAFLTGMPSMVRTRFSTPTIGREWMVGELGRAITDINPDGVVQIQGAPWRAYTNRATPIEQLDSVRVVGIEGLVLEVEPEEGAARDYRERGAKSVKTPGDDAG